jgi:hypothetical protein
MISPTRPCIMLGKTGQARRAADEQQKLIAWLNVACSEPKFQMYRILLQLADSVTFAWREHQWHCIEQAAAGPCMQTGQAHKCEYGIQLVCHLPGQ